MFYLQMNSLYHTIKSIVLLSFSRHKLKLLSKYCVFKVCQYVLTWVKHSNLTHGIIPMLSREGFTLMYMYWNSRDIVVM